MDESLARPKMTPKDFFLYLGIAGSLYVSAGSLLALLFAVVNLRFPDPLSYGYYYAPTALEALRFPLSALLVMFPLFLFLSWYVRKEVQREPKKLELWVRRWFVWLTLFVAGATLVGDVIALLNTFLGGEITVRFVLKMLSVFVVAAAIFGYYLYDLRRSARGDTSINRPLIVIAALGVLASIVLGFLAIGSPATQRAMRLDAQRVEDLRNLQWQIRDYWQAHQGLPPAQGDLLDSLSGNVVPKDPETLQSYEYRILGPRTFELCATFTTSNTLDTPVSEKERLSRELRAGLSPDFDEYFEHDAGRTCFERTIDSQRYPPYPKN
ncbi:MAG TPA: DUF5671 domain-containing protein [Candidatus Paceibacterota bacterium]|nr:DUF5671 domain-containing protein [Candidatus Paceibacterota bacterium]